MHVLAQLPLGVVVRRVGPRVDGYRRAKEDGSCFDDERHDADTRSQGGPRLTAFVHLATTPAGSPRSTRDRRTLEGRRTATDSPASSECRLCASTARSGA